MSNNTEIQKVEEKTGGIPATWKESLRFAEPKFLAIADPVKTKQELGFAMQLIQNNVKLQQCDPSSIMNAVINVARVGITLNPVMRLAHLVPRSGKCVLDFSYMGLIKVLKDAGCVKYMDAFIVYDDEKFVQSPSNIYDIVHEIKHVKTEKEQKARSIYGVYSRVVLPSGETIFTQITPMWQIEKRKNVAQTKFVWEAWAEEMILKTKIKLDFKLLISGDPDKAKQLAEVMKLDEEANPVTLNPPKVNNMAALLGGNTTSTEDTDYTEVVTITTYQCIKDLQLEGGIIKKDSIGEIRGSEYYFQIGPKLTDVVGYTVDEIAVYVPEFFQLITK